MRFTTLQKTLIACLITAGASLAAAPVQAQNDDGQLVTAVKKVADDVAAYLMENGGVQEFTMGAFASIPPGGIATLQVKNELLKNLQEQGVRAKRTAKFSCTGEFRFNEGAKKVEILVNIHERGTFRKSCTAQIFKVTDLAVLLGGTGQISTDNKERETSLAKTFTNPQPQVESSPPSTDAAIKTVSATRPVADPPKTLVRADTKGKFGMEILRQGSGGVYEPVEVEQEDGLLFVSLDIGDVYAIRFLNNTGRLAGATVSIDGLNMFSFSDNPDYQRLGKIIVHAEPGGAIVKGWHKSNTESYSFKVVDVGEAAVSELKGGDAGLLQVDDSLGIITAKFCFAIDANDPQSRFPDDEPATLALGTAKGPIIQQSMSEIRAKFGVDREIISIRYDRLPPPPAAE